MVRKGSPYERRVGVHCWRLTNTEGVYTRRRPRRLEWELSEWWAEVALSVRGDLTAASRKHLRWLMERTLETEMTRLLGATLASR
jgi:hypothetical protein